MPVVQIGRTTIPYELRRSESVRERRITVTPEAVEVLLPAADTEEELAQFLARKRRWIYESVRQVKRVASQRHGVPRFATGSTIPYRGRKMRLTVRRTDGGHFEISYRNGFIVDLPHWAPECADHLIVTELKLWLKHRARRDAIDVARRYSRTFDLTPKSVRVDDLTHGWGSCGAEGNILINWHLIFAPAKVLEYVVVHELAHLLDRSHERLFWNRVQTMMPDYRIAKTWLDQNGSTLSDSFLSAPQSA